MPLSVDPYRKRIMVDFNVLIDTDLGSAIYLQKNTTNKKFFQEHIPKANLFYLQYMSLTRKEENPIEYMFADEYKGYTDNIYGELQAEKWDKVLDVSPKTSILTVFLAAYKDAGYKITVNCRNNEEVKRVHLLTHDWNTKINIKDTSPFFCLYIHDIYEILRNDWDVKGKSVYLYNYSKNHPNDEMTDEDAIHPIAFAWKDTTEFFFISPYRDFKMPVG